MKQNVIFTLYSFYCYIVRFLIRKKDIKHLIMYACKLLFLERQILLKNITYYICMYSHIMRRSGGRKLAAYPLRRFRKTILDPFSLTLFKDHFKLIVNLRVYTHNLK
jgi:hypothetical protein